MSGYIGTQPVPQATQTRDAFTCTAGQTSFATSGYTPNFLDVYLNGVKLAAADYTASNSVDVVLAVGAALNDILEVVAYTTFEVVIAATAAQGVLADSAVQPNDSPTFGTVTATSFAGDGSNLTGILGTPAGAVIYHAANTPPTGFIKANGAAISRTTYADLFSAIGTTFGAGDGSTTFLVPDLRGEFLRGWDDARGVDSGRSFGSAQSDAMRNLTGGFKFRDDDGASYAIALSYANGVFSGVNHSGNPFNSGGSGGGQSFSSGVDFNASNQVTTAAEFRPRNIALLACIKY